MKKFSVQNLLDWLEIKGLLEHRAHAESYLLCEQNVAHHAFYLKLIMDLIGLIAFGLLMWGLSRVFSVNMDFNHFTLVTASIPSLVSNFIFILSGLALMAVSIFIYHRSKLCSDLMQNGCFSFALFTMLSGKILFLIGFSMLPLPLFPTIKLLIGLLLVVPLSYFYFPLAIDRFLSTLALLFCLMIALMSNSLIEFHFIPNIGFLINYLLLVLVVSFLFSWKNKPISINPAAYAGVAMLCLNAISLSFLNEQGANNMGLSLTHVPTLYFDLILGVILIAQCLYFAGGWQKVYELPILFTILALGVLSLIANNGILLAISLLMLSYAKHERPLCIIAGVFFILFLIEYYWQLPAALTYKAILLIASGVMLLAIRWVIKYEHWD